MLRRSSIFLALLVAFSCGRKTKKEVIYTDLVAEPIGPYSQAIRSGGTLFVSGQIAMNVNGTFDTSSVEAETKQVLENIKAIVEEAGMTLKDVTKATVYLKDMKQFAQMNKVFETYFKDDPPARETVEVKALPKGAHVEISVIAK